MDDTEQAEIYRQTLVDAKATERQPELKPIGECWYCGEPVEGKKLFCSKECRDSYEHLVLLNHINGGNL